MRRKNNESGAILAIVIIFMFVVTITGLAFLNSTVMEYRLAMREVHKEQAFWLAEGGVEDARFKLGQNWQTWTGDPPVNIDGALDTGIYEAKIYNTNFDESGLLPVTERRINSVGTAKELSRTVEVIVRQPPIDARTGSAIESGGSIDIKSGAADILGNAVAAGSIDDPHGGITGTPSPNDDRFNDPFNVPQEYLDQGGDPLEFDYFEWIFNASKEEVKEKAWRIYSDSIVNEEVKNITWVEGGGQWSQITQDIWEGQGAFIVDGNLKITGGTFTGIIWVTGNLEITAGNPYILGAVFVEGQTLVDITGNVTIEYNEDAVGDALDQIAKIPWVSLWREIP